MKGTPLGELGLRFRGEIVGHVRVRLDPGEERGGKTEMSTAPASAVPIDAPRFVKVFCSPPTSPLCSSGTDETVTLPSCDASAPMPRPASSIGQVTISGPAPASSAATSTTRPAKSMRNPKRTTRAGRRRETLWGRRPQR